MNAIRVYLYGDNPIRVFGSHDSPCFIATDVYRCMGLTQTSHIAEILPESERGLVTPRQAWGSGNSETTSGNGIQLIYVTEPGLYRLIFRSDKPEARKFQDWVFREVLPQIRKTGAYSRMDESWREMFRQAKTGRVQMALLHAAGVTDLDGATRGIARVTSGLAIQPAAVITPEEFWQKVHDAVMDGKLAGDAFRPRYSLKGFPAANLLAVNASALIKVVFSKMRPVFGGNPRVEIRHSLGRSREWVAGSHRCRFGIGAETTACWVFQVLDTSPRPLVDLMVELHSAGNAEGMK